ncbi:MAG: FAD-binding oxidoreductase [Thermoplasmata archaeon]|nr:MAG: FAD-binding oxidoreductase [Thermoplasmata archaeon]
MTAKADEDKSEKKEESDAEEIQKIQHSQLYESLAEIIHESRISEYDFERRLYSHDVAPLPKMMEMGFKMLPDVIVRPKDAKEVSKIVKLAIEKQIPVVPRGGASWALGGAVPIMGGILLDMATMNDIIEINKKNLTVMVEPGITWGDLDNSLRREGYMIGAYPSSAPAATVGGWINTGGVGVGSYKYGGVDRQVLAMEMVLPKGEVATFGSNFLDSDSLGDNLHSFFAGTEGTLGIVTRVTLRIYPTPEELRSISYTFPSLESMTNAIYELTHSEVTPFHISFFDKNHFDYLKLLGKEVPDARAIVNLALEGTKVSLDAEERTVDKLMRKNKGEKQSKEFSDHEWEMRLFEMNTKRLGPTIMLAEGMIPVSRLNEMIKGTLKIFKKMKLNGAITGMVPDRNTIAFMPYCLTDERKLRSMMAMALTKKIGDLSFKLGGRPAGLGLFFTGNLKKMHGQGADVMKNIKSAMDPHDVINPGKTLEGMTRFGVPIPAFGMNMGMDMLALAARLPGMKHKLHIEPNTHHAE